MERLVFSSWGGDVIDNRKKPKAGVRPPNGLPVVKNGGLAAAIVGWNGIVTSDPEADVVGLVIAYLKEARQLSCGECSVCSLGIDEALGVINGVVGRVLQAEALARLESIVELVAENARCNFGRVAAMAPLADALKYFREDFAPGGEMPVKREVAHRKLVTAPCMQACPAGLDIPGYIELIKNNRFADSLSLIRERCIMPGVIGRACTHPCEEACVRGEIDEPLAIRLLKRSAADDELKAGTGVLPVGASPKEKIAVVGSGPAGLSVAFNLRKMGYSVMVFEAQPKAGGMAALGIPDYRLPKDILNYEIDLIKRMGVEIKLNKKIDALDWNALQKEGFKALYLAVGAHVGTKIGCGGEDVVAPDFVQGVDFLRDLALGRVYAPVKRVAVIGGGNVAMDCARNCVRLGYRDVVIVYRRSEAEMPASKAEIKEAREEGVRFEFLRTPVNVVRGNNGVLEGVECIEMKLGAPDGSGRRRPLPVKGSEKLMETDMVIAATGQKPDLSFIGKKTAGILSVTDWGTIKVDAVTFSTGVEGVFAGGDCVTGAATLVEALDAGNRAAVAISSYLEGKRLEKGGTLDVDAKQQRDRGFVVLSPRKQSRHLDGKGRVKGYEEVENGFSKSDAVDEAKRCLRCYRLVVWA